MGSVPDKFVGVLTIASDGGISAEVLQFNTVRDAARYAELLRRSAHKNLLYLRIAQGPSATWCREALSYSACEARDAFERSFKVLPINPHFVKTWKKRKS